ncbi:hypothetical protein RIF29_22561 [Crotalaria pallida]|uniref:Bifunctional inhibitor/plant lipid transfer protein/seed storage helical domain-containing protein n=1 Tax=Crotalaria pallida TaxID=3830 RepID=A0AAN9F6J1_CROPI
MAQSSGNNVLLLWLVAALLISLLVGAKATVICNIDSTKLDLCLSAVTGTHPPKPDKKCCAVISDADLPCLCGYKSVLPALGIDPTHALALPGKCGLKTPHECIGNHWTELFIYMTHASSFCSELKKDCISDLPLK